MSRIAIENRYRTGWYSTPNLRLDRASLGSEQFNEILDRAIDIFSIESPGDNTNTIEITAGEKEALLPVDFLTDSFSNKEELKKAWAGINTGNRETIPFAFNQQTYKYPFTDRSLLIQQSVDIKLRSKNVDGIATPVWLLPTTVASDTNIDLVYQSRHTVRNASASLVLTDQPNPGDTISYSSNLAEGVLTFVADNPGTSEIEIGASLTATLTNISTEIKKLKTKVSILKGTLSITSNDGEDFDLSTDAPLTIAYSSAENTIPANYVSPLCMMIDGLALTSFTVQSLVSQKEIIDTTQRGNDLIAKAINLIRKRTP